MNEWISLAVIFAVGAGYLGPLFWSLHIATIPIEADDDGWTRVTPTIFDHLQAGVMFLLALGFLAFGALSVLGGALDKGRDVQAFLILMAIIATMFLWHFVYNYLSKIKFNSENLAYSTLAKKILVSWSGVEEIKMGMNGPKVVTVEGSFTVPNTRRGFYQLIDMARKSDVKVQNTPYLKSPDHMSFFKKKPK